MTNILWVLLFSTFSWALSADEQLKAFDKLMAKHPEQIWVKDLDPKLSSAIQDFNKHKKVGKKLVYGDSIRNYPLNFKCAADIEKDMKMVGCTKQIDVIRDPQKNEPILTDGKPSPIWQFVCPDGGVVKVKPEGDPSSKFTPFPHASRVLRYPAESEYRDYRDEVAKLSRDGHIIPKGPGDLAPKDLVDGWSKEAHIPLRSCEKK
ncbi:MAG: hypothetical protein ACXWQO_08875 [Bdellovibrionota bacterium]